ncbi:putative bifunctional diguanylate cyclase/phosphodiesterase [Aurantiacibacter sp. D1-12]|uniref:putative bifunctional diguanylate cyclase/phosphodiesterase n=1 Tax=Aurantiacibacter sp. D1-12 TaxID=2993658 RepID=UPI00237C65F0|nr:EAL domain-containing protein [Aurantiacibacter sp. D1-12]MDE1468330.1 EAL domain-containing protein [Aurantiacibacter sp. D1-12]
MGVRGMFKNLGGQGAEPISVPDAEAAARKISKVDAKERLEMLDAFEAAGIAWLWATDPEGNLIYLSDSAVETFDDKRPVIGEPLGKLIETVCETESEGRTRPLSFLLSSRTSFVEQPVRVIEPQEGRASEDSETWWALTGKPQYDAKENFLGYRGSAKDITAVYQDQRDSSRMAEYDSLTGLANRHRMTRRLTAILNAYKVEKRSCALLMLDLDRFKQVNDTLGHPAGDELLRQVSQRLQRIVPEGSEIGRLGGDEFQIMIPDMDDRGDLGELSNRIISMISQPYSIEGSRAIIGTSIGVAIAPYDGIEPNELIKATDLALYAAKGGGRGQFRFYSNDLKETAEDRREIEEDLRDALVRGELEMHYQPVVDAKTHIVRGFEALMRWEHPVHGAVSPGIFIPIAEDSNLIDELGAWALRQACEDAGSWPSDLTVSVNVSAQQFVSDNLPSVVQSALQTSGLNPDQLELEITESVFMGDVEATDAMFKTLSKLGVKLALDDFGTGYSSLAYLRRAPFDKIKIDQSFVRGCTEDDNSNAAIITAIVSLARAMDMVTTAEGVEALDELDKIAALDADMVQGFIFSRAVPQADVLAKLEAGELKYEPIGPAKSRADRRTLFRRISVIHENHHYTVMLRDLSRTGARIEGLVDVPVGTQLVLDLGEGQLVVCTVMRSQDATQGLSFETSLVTDGAGGLCTRHRVSPYMLASAGMPLQALPPGNYKMPTRDSGPDSTPRFMQVDVSAGSSRAR